jgi:flagella basal body P-ring formation protein FlgA
MQRDGDGLSATLSVVCMEDGGASKTVRVRETASKRIYRAQIVGQGLLHAVGLEN